LAEPATLAPAAPAEPATLAPAAPVPAARGPGPSPPRPEAQGWAGLRVLLSRGWSVFVTTQLTSDESIFRTDVGIKDAAR